MRSARACLPRSASTTGRSSSHFTMALLAMAPPTYHGSVYSHNEQLIMALLVMALHIMAALLTMDAPTISPLAVARPSSRPAARFSLRSSSPTCLWRSSRSAAPSPAWRSRMTATSTSASSAARTPATCRARRSSACAPLHNAAAMRSSRSPARSRWYAHPNPNPNPNPNHPSRTPTLTRAEPAPAPAPEPEHDP